MSVPGFFSQNSSLVFWHRGTQYFANVSNIWMASSFIVEKMLSCVAPVRAEAVSATQLIALKTVSQQPLNAVKSESQKVMLSNNADPSLSMVAKHCS
jgi:hypothetical protein